MSILDWFGIGPKQRAHMTVQWKSYDSGYHMHFERRARSFGLKGWMRVQRFPMYNMLEAEVEGTENNIKGFLDDLKSAPATAMATQANVLWLAYKGNYEDFRVRS